MVPVWADTGRAQEQPQTHGWNAKSKFFFVTSRTGGSPKHHLGRGTQAGTQAPQSLVCARDLLDLVGFARTSGIHTGGVFHCAFISPTAGQQSQVCLMGCLYHRPMLSKSRCSTCQARKTKQRLVWYMCFSTPQLQATWAYSQSSLPIFPYFPHSALYDIQALCFTVELMQTSEDMRDFGQILTSAGHCASETRVPWRITGSFRGAQTNDPSSNNTITSSAWTFTQACCFQLQPSNSTKIW